MKKFVFMLCSLLAGEVLVSCEKDEVGGTATEATAGQWYVTVDAADESGNVVEGFEDLFGLGRIIMLTANTAANVPTEMILTDNSEFWDFKVKVACDPNAMTFQTTTSENNNLVPDYEDINVTVTNGKILPMAGTQNNGTRSDSIIFYISFSDDEYPAAYGYKNYKVSGIRYSGLVEND